MATRRQPDEQMLTALVARLTSQTTDATYTEVPQGTLAPYRKVNGVTGRREDTMGRFGASNLVDVIAITNALSQQPGLQMRDRAVQALDFQRLTMTGHTMLGCSWDQNEYFTEVVNGVKHHHHVATFRIWTEQSSS